ncbi:MAG TPA: hypothetical protein VIF09_13010, partial [Polyangiaceae bacterium]
MSHARIAKGAALAGVIGAILSAAGTARADCTDGSCPRDVAQAMSESGARRPLVLSFGLRSLSYMPSSRDRFDGNLSAGPMSYQFNGDSLGGDPVRTFGGEVGADLLLTPFVYIGAAGAWGEGSWSTTPFAAGDVMVQPRGTINAHIWQTGLRAGVRIPLGPITARAELLGGAQWISLEQQAVSTTMQMVGGASTVTWLVEPRAAVDLWTTPYTVLSAFA